MSGIENLFVSEPSMPETQRLKMPEDAGQWSEVLTSHLKEKFPEIANLPIEVETRKMESATGTAIGALRVESPETGKSVLVPYIVRKFELCPLDIWMESKTQAVHPLTEDTFKKAFHLKSHAEGLDARPQDAVGSYFNDPSLWTSTYPPLQGRYSYASAGYPLLDIISDDMHEGDLRALKETLQNNPYLVAKFQKNGHEEIIKKLAQKATAQQTKDKGPRGLANTNNFAASVAKLIPTSIADIRKEGPDKYSILSFADKLFDLAESSELDLKACTDHLSKLHAAPVDILHEVDQEGEKTLYVGKPPEAGVFLYEDLDVRPVQCSEFGAYFVKDKAGISFEGMVIPHVVDLSGKRKSVQLFLGKEKASMQDRVAGIPAPNSTVSTTVLKPSRVRVGQTGTFLFLDDGKALATVPVTITAVEKYSDKFKAVTLDGRRISIKQHYSDAVPCEPVRGPKKKNFLDAHGFLEEKRDEYIIPRRMVWIPMEGFQEVTSTPADWMAKEAALKSTANPLVIKHFGSDFYKLAGNHLETIGKAGDYSERQTKVILAGLGASLEKIAQITKKARRVGKVEVHGLRRPEDPQAIEKRAHGVYSNLEKICSQLRANLIKEAAEVDEAATVDSMLALNFLRPENLAKFVSYRKALEKCSDYLAELTLASRLGLKDVSEHAATSGMRKLMEISEGLKKTESGMKPVKTKTAAVNKGLVAAAVSKILSKRYKVNDVLAELPKSVRDNVLAALRKKKSELRKNPQAGF